MMDILEIQKHIPHRYPFLLVDRILEVEKGHRIVGIRGCPAWETLLFP